MPTNDGLRIKDHLRIEEGYLAELHAARQELARVTAERNAFRERWDEALVAALAEVTAERDRLAEVVMAAKKARGAAGTANQHMANCNASPCATCEGLDVAELDAETDLDMLLAHLDAATTNALGLEHAEPTQPEAAR